MAFAVTGGVILTTLRMRGSSARALIQALRALARPARSEKGFLNCQLNLDADETNTVRYEERWQTEEDLREQLRSGRYTRLLALMETAAEPPALEFHFVSETRGLDYVAEVRGEGESIAR